MYIIDDFGETNPILGKPQRTLQILPMTWLSPRRAFAPTDSALVPAITEQGRGPLKNWTQTPTEAARDNPLWMKETVRSPIAPACLRSTVLD
jgi:hypothetical protein